MEQTWTPAEHLEDEIENMEGIAQVLRTWPKQNMGCGDEEKFMTIARMCASDIGRAIKEIKEIFADLTKQGNGTQRINLTVTGEIGENPAAGVTRPFPNVKLNRSKAREIRKRYFSGDGSQASLANDYGVNMQTINRIVRNQAWKEATV